ncbi:deoxyribodipyrimidine photo-lyase [Tundrisphaera lichenicola]|uniref:deoxyribodipyrimidine photo-lyase n=1 Tax=Tundrisphaera lichenicola TaxID=2029860 RepID=UPI003EB6F2FF
MPDFENRFRDDPRVRIVRPGEPDPSGGCVVYWMQRAQRSLDNPALNHAIELGNLLKRPVLAVFGLTADYPEAERRHYRFLVDGLPDTRDGLLDREVPLVVRIGSPAEVALTVAHEAGASIVVIDENPLRIGQVWREKVARELSVPCHAVDADVVVPSSLFPKEEYAARTIRPKIHKVWDRFLVPMENPKAQVVWKSEDLPRGEPIEPVSLLEKLRVGGVSQVLDYRGGTAEALRRLDCFVRQRLPKYATERNEPVPYMTSELSAHLHFGQISPLTIALAASKAEVSQENKDSYLEELIVRRELAINYVARNPNYDRLEGCASWALKTLAKHSEDVRPVLYSASQLESAETGDPLWNASQKEMMITGRMHNYLRMYWGKKILEWTPDPETAFHLALSLNDRYEMDGRDPNGYTGVAWAIGGKHDRPWIERQIFGMIRFMSYESTRKKFDSKAYIARVDELEKGKSRP